MYNPALSTLFVINGAHTSPFVKETDDLIALADDVEGMVFCRTVLHLRRSFVKAMGLGKSVIEMDDEKATLEVQSLFEEIIG
jgi:chromosome partitioning protein